MKRAVIIAKGEVQQVGYRDIVRKIARKLEITGFVGNMEFYDVEIVAEGEEDALNTFITQIKIEKYPVAVGGLNVEFSDATGEFEHFKVKRGDWKDELGERLDTAGALLYRSVELGAESVKLGRESVEIGRNMLDKQDAHTNILVEKLDAHTNILTDLRDQTQQNFEILDVKYGSISDNMERVIEEMRGERKESRESMKGLTDAILKLAERR